MDESDDDLKNFLEESQEHLSSIESDLLVIEQKDDEIDVEQVNKVFRAVHSIKGGANFLGLTSITRQAHSIENILNLIRKQELVPSSEVINLLLEAADNLKYMLNNPDKAEQYLDEKIITSLENLSSKTETTPDQLPTTDSIEEESVENSAPINNQNLVIALADGTKLFDIPIEPVETALNKFYDIYVAKLHLIDDIEAKEITIEEITNELNEMSLLTVVYDKDSEYCYFFIITLLNFANLKKFFEIDSNQISVIPPSEFIQSFRNSYILPEPNETESTKVEASLSEGNLVMETNDQPAKDRSSEVQSNTESKSENSTDDSKTSSQGQAAADSKEGSIRINVGLLDKLMTLAGELVLTRNQVMQTVSSWDRKAMEIASQRLDLITSELQENIMSTRMQPIGNIFNRFHRVVRDLSRSLSKSVNLIIEGEDVDLDKTIIETIGDPLTHLVRNAIDHGLESIEERSKAGKNPEGTLKIAAYHEAGQVIIEISDDGKGIDPEKVKQKSLEVGLADKAQLETMGEKEIINLIFKPGFSTAEKITDVSGRGVGMDVVFTNLTKLGGTIDVDTQIGMGSTFKIKLPLTLAIIPSLLVSVSEKRFAIPQVNLVELVRIPPAKVKERIEKIGEACMIRLRGEILPLVRLRDFLGMEEPVFVDPETEELKPEQRINIADRRDPTNSEFKDTEFDNRQEDERRVHAQSSINIAVVSSGDFHYGLIVDNLLDSEEIVVKPLGYHLRQCQGYAGAAVLGDGSVALIVDIVGIGKSMELSLQNNLHAAAMQEQVKAVQDGDVQSLIIIENGDNERYAVPLGVISRLERISHRQVEEVNGKQVIKYRGEALPLISISDALETDPPVQKKQFYVIVFSVGGKEIGVMANTLVDAVQIEIKLDQATFKKPGVLGSMLIMDKITLFLDLYELVNAAMPELAAAGLSEDSEGKGTILLVEDTPFFLKQIKKFIENEGYHVITATDGVKGLAELKENREKIKLVVTDIEMPHMNGLEMTKEIRKDTSLSELPILAVTSLTGSDAEQEGLEAGITEYMIKLDRDQVVNALNRHLGEMV